MPTVHIDTHRLGELPALTLSLGEARATLTPFGAQVLSWIPEDGQERLYLSESAALGGAQPIRGGIPIVFPQFGTLGPGARHGFARTHTWRIDETRQGEDYVLVTLQLDPSLLEPGARTAFPHDFLAEVTVLLSERRLDVELAVRNTGTAPFAFTAALHTYLAVPEIERSALQGLGGSEYTDPADPSRWHAEPENVTRLEPPLDRLYRGGERVLTLATPTLRTEIAQAGFGETVLWNPGEHGPADLPAGAWRHFVCIEAAQASVPVSLRADEEWAGRQALMLPER